MEKIKKLLFRAKMNLVHGVDVVDNSDFITEEVVIRYKDFFISIYINEDTGEPYDFGWTSGSPMTHVPVKDFYTAKRNDDWYGKSGNAKNAFAVLKKNLDDYELLKLKELIASEL